MGGALCGSRPTIRSSRRSKSFTAFWDLSSRSRRHAWEGGRSILQEVANLIAERLVNLYRRGEHGIVPALRRDSPFQNDGAWKDLCFFYEYFHGETGQGLGAAHQTGWTGLLANLVMRRYQKDITSWRTREVGARPSWIDELA